MPMRPHPKHGKTWRKTGRPERYATPAGRGQKYREAQIAADLASKVLHAWEYGAELYDAEQYGPMMVRP